MHRCYIYPLYPLLVSFVSPVTAHHCSDWLKNPHSLCSLLTGCLLYKDLIKHVNMSMLDSEQHLPIGSVRSFRAAQELYPVNVVYILSEKVISFSLTTQIMSLLTGTGISNTFLTRCLFLPVNAVYKWKDFAVDEWVGQFVTTRRPLLLIHHLTDLIVCLTISLCPYRLKFICWDNNIAFT